MAREASVEIHGERRWRIRRAATTIMISDRNATNAQSAMVITPREAR